MLIEDLKCDCCGITAHGKEYHYGLPRGWYIVGYHCQSYLAYDDWRVMYHFCSGECLDKTLGITGKEKKAELEPPNEK